MNLKELQQKQEAEFSKIAIIEAIRGKQKLEEFFHTATTEAYSAGAKEERERIKKLIEELKTDERKVSIFGKGMDSWKARNYDEKQLVNAVLKDLEKVV